MSIQQFQTGKRVYGAGTYAPNKGQVSASGSVGYLQRELRNRNKGNQNTFGGVSKVGNDGESDTRSGNAARMLAGQSNKAAANIKKITTQKKKTTGGNGLTGQQSVAAAGSTGAGVTVPEMKVTPSGTIELAYNGTFSSEMASALNDSNQSLIELMAQDQQQSADYARANNEADDTYGKQQVVSRNTAGGGGSLFSSAYAQQVGNDDTAYTKQKNELASANTSYQQNSAIQRQGIQNALALQLQQSALALQEEQQAAAGTLGYGNAGAKTNKHQGKGPNKQNQKNQPKAPAKKGKK